MKRIFIYKIILIPTARHATTGIIIVLVNNKGAVVPTATPIIPNLCTRIMLKTRLITASEATIAEYIFWRETLTNLGFVIKVEETAGLYVIDVIIFAWSWAEAKRSLNNCLIIYAKFIG